MYMYFSAKHKCASNDTIVFFPNVLSDVSYATEIIVSGGMTMPQLIAPLERIPSENQSVRLNRITTQ